MIKVQAPELYRDSGAYEARKRQSLRARYVYGLIFFATNLLAWFIRGCTIHSSPSKPKSPR